MRRDYHPRAMGPQGAGATIPHCSVRDLVQRGVARISLPV